MSLYRKKIRTNSNTKVNRGNEPFFKSVILNGVDILRVDFSYKNQQFSGLFPPPFLTTNNNDIANFRNPTNNLIKDTNFTNNEIYSLGIIDNTTQYVTGTITPNGSINSDIVFNIDCNEDCSLSIISGSLPSGLSFNDFGNNTAIITGNINNIDTTKLFYDFIIRAQSNSGAKIDRYFRFIISDTLVGINWNQSWLNSLLSITNVYEYNGYKVYPIAYSSNLITNIYSLLQLDNPYDLPVNYEIVPNTLSSNTVIPDGIHLQNNLIYGIPDNNTVLDTYYFFSIKASIEYNGTKISGKNGIDTSDTIFYLYVSSDNTSANNIDSTNIIWLSDSNLGSINEQTSITFNVEAETSDGSDIIYTLINSTLPDGLNLSSTGYLYGISPYTNGKDQNVTFTVRASTKSTYSDKTFYFVIKGVNKSNDLLTISLPLFNREKSIISKLIFNPDNVPDEAVFRLNIDNIFGRQTQPAINLVSSLNKVDTETLVYNLYEYYRPLNLRMGNLSYSKVYDPSGNYIYDVIYINVIDSNDRGNAFDSSYNEQIMYAQQNSLKNGCPQWNIPVPSNNTQYEKTRIFPSNLFNFRYNLIETNNRQGYQEGSLATDMNQLPEGFKKGIGVNGTENIPQWMISANDGWFPAIPIVYLNKNYGEEILNNLLNDELINELIGSQIKIDRFMVSEVSYSYTLFDVVDENYTDLGALTSFDSCAAETTNGACTQLYPSLLSWTQFDFENTISSYYIKFPPGDLF